MYLQDVIGSKTKINILSVLTQSPNQGIIESTLAKKAEASASEVNRQIKDLVAIGLVTLTRVGRSKQYTINTQHFLYTPLENLFKSLNKVYREITEKVKDHAVSHDKVEAVLLFGSAATKTIRQDYVSNPSDIDIVVVVEDKTVVNDLKNKLLQYTTHEIFPAYGVNVYCIVLSKSEYITGLRDDHFIMNVHVGGTLLYGEKPSRFSQMGPRQGNAIP